MNPATIIREALTEGVTISLSTTGKIKAVGNEISVIRWLPVIRENKISIATLLLAANDPAPTRLHGTDVSAIRAWLASIGETNPATILEILDKCAGNPDVLAYYMSRAAENLQESDRNATCTTCDRHRTPEKSAGYCGDRDDLPLAYGLNHSLRKLPEDGGVSCDHWKGK